MAKMRVKRSIFVFTEDSVYTLSHLSRTIFHNTRFDTSTDDEPLCRRFSQLLSSKNHFKSEYIFAGIAKYHQIYYVFVYSFNLCRDVLYPIAYNANECADGFCTGGDYVYWV